MAWAEAWFIDFRVLPQEARAKTILEAASGAQRSSRDPVTPQLEAVRNYFSNYPETIADFYSPMESPFASDDEDEDSRRDVTKLTPKEMQIQAAGCEALQLAWDTINSSGWKLEKESSHGDTVQSKLGSKGSKLYKLVGEVEIEPKILFDEMVYNFENMSKWNKAMTLSKIVQLLMFTIMDYYRLLIRATIMDCLQTIDSSTVVTIDSSTDVVYQVAAEGPGGIVTARDFVNVRHWKKIGDNWVSGGISVIHDDEPPQKSIVRGENGPGCWVFRPVEGTTKKCSFQWLLDTDLKGWIPQYVIDQALTHAMIDFMNCIRSYAPVIKGNTSEKYNFR
ncbi:StAR-related lipid transfer protein 3 [Halocaridina rubra]|uniref:StAR-related lipid transfer protein 3 n=1 Tax=Halocaridina rubra TaxID=373956 RepID=A0AAN8X0H1_HALRR